MVLNTDIKYKVYIASIKMGWTHVRGSSKIQFFNYNDNVALIRTVEGKEKTFLARLNFVLGQIQDNSWAFH